MEYAAVAVITDRQGKLARFSDDVLARVYRREKSGWVLSAAVPFLAEPGENPARMRGRLRDFVAALGDTRILIAASISGIAYSVLDQRGFRLCEMDGFDPECLDALIESLNAPSNASDVPDRPMATGEPGVYECDLMLMLREYPELSSKKILLPFLADAAFTELRIACGHVPPWLPPEMKRRGFVCKGPTAEGGKLRLLIYPPKAR
ncbi:MAG: hypothetical protein LBQ51_09150 [Desulfovibrio sp.]|jgi:hypothetical protein|nr:hypothetical protein [Desulfovibrio sp.]